MENKSNRLIHEKSPYLLQHAFNPVDWYPWGEEAFSLAKSLDKPIFLSIGYATCHWCHVMEKESFANPKTAKVLNDTFVCIKVDREELPEIDGLYMEFAQVLMASSGGWPLNVVLTPDLKPFFAATYLPPVNSQGMMGLEETALHIKSLWQGQDRLHIQDEATQMVALYKESMILHGEDEIKFSQLQDAMQAFLDLADAAYGGLKGNYKFPLSFHLDFLLKYALLFDEERPLFYVELTFEMMQRGGIYDHIGGGFSRYAVDDKWQIPHFEKMLSDNAVLAKNYLDAFVFFKKRQYKDVAEETLNYLLREMKHEKGAFFTAQDADSLGKEGLYYTWPLKEIVKEVEENKELFLDFYNVTKEGNFEERNVLYASDSIEEFAEKRHLDKSFVKNALQEIKKKLFLIREKREKPFIDDKIIVSFNALAIQSFLRAGEILENKTYTDAGLAALKFLEKDLIKEGRLYRRYRDNEAKFSANLEDYAFLISAYLTAFEYGHGVSFLEKAIFFTEVLQKDFKLEGGAFYFSHQENDTLLVRKCEFNDGSEPSGNSMHAENLLRLYTLTQDPSYLEMAEDIFKAASSLVAMQPQSYSYLLSSLLRYFDKKAFLLVVVLDEVSSLKEEVKKLFREHYFPHTSFIFVEEKNADLLKEKLPFLKEKPLIDGQSALYLCTKEKCYPPILKIEDLKKIISSL